MGLSAIEQKVYHSIIESIIMDLVLGCVKDKKRFCQKCGTTCHLHQFSSDTERYMCPCCSKTFVSTRFAQHMEKCMGLKDTKSRKKKSESPSKSVIL